MQPLRADEAQILIDTERGNVVDFSLEGDLYEVNGKQGGPGVYDFFKILTSSASSAIIFSMAIFTREVAIP